MAMGQMPYARKFRQCEQRCAARLPRLSRILTPGIPANRALHELRKNGTLPVDEAWSMILSEVPSVA